MNATDDAELLRRYAEGKSEEAFAELTRRHLDLVWSAAWRVTGDADAARDVAQTVFADLARKARWLAPETVIPGWLYRAATLAARKSARANARRAAREKAAMELRSESEPGFEQLEPLLDEAISHLGEADRNAIALRFLARKSLAEVGASLGVSDDAAQKRLSRALEKLRGHFRARGVTVSAAGLGAALSAAGAQGAPAGLAAAVAAASLPAAEAGLGAFFSQLQTQIIIMKTKIAVAALAAVSIGVPVAMQEQKLSALKEENKALAAQAAMARETQPENTREQAEELERLRAGETELARLREEIQGLRQVEQAMAGPGWEEARAALRNAQARSEQARTELAAKQLREDTVSALKHLGLAARIFATDNQERFPKTFDNMKNVLPEALPGHLELDRFEFVPHERAISEAEPQMLMFREKSARQQADGTWLRAYAYADGSVEERSSPDGNFEEWEKAGIARANSKP